MSSAPSKGVVAMAVCRFCGHDNAGDRVACDKCGVPLLVARRPKAPQDPRIDKDSQSEIVIAPSRWAPLGVLLGVSFGLLAFSVGLTGSLVDQAQRGGWLAVTGMGAVLVVLGILAISATTRIDFNQPPGYMTMRWGMRGYWPYIVRTKHISKEEARTVSVHPIQVDWFFIERTAYQVRVIMTGKKVTLHQDQERDVADYLTQRISEFGAGKDLPDPSR